MYSKTYITQLQSLHNDRSRPTGFGGKVKDLGKFYSYMDKWQPRNLLDYGCGKGTILSHIQEKYSNTRCYGYDPAVSIFNNLPASAVECVFSNDVLEHIEPEYINDVLLNINKFSIKYVWLRIDTMPARKKLSDGRNAHLILEDPEWWINKIKSNIGGDIVYTNLNSKGKFDVAIEK